MLHKNKLIAKILLCVIIIQVIQPMVSISVFADTKAEQTTEEIGTKYEIKETEEWDVSKKGDRSVIAKWNKSDRSLTITGTGEMKSWVYRPTEDWHNNRYTNAIKRVSIEEGVTNIGVYAFYFCSSLESITIPSSITSIEYGAFSNCSRLTSIEIPSSVTSIRSSAFEECSSLKSITIPSSVTSIEYGVFSDCSSLESIIIPSSVTIIWNSAFSRCSSLKSITIPSSVTSIGERAFNGCSSLESIKIPSSVTSISDYAFNECSSLTSINVVTNNANYKSENGILFNKDKTEIIKYPEGKTDISEYQIPSSVTRIWDDAFNRCSSLDSIEIPSSVTSIGDSATPSTALLYVTRNSAGHKYAEENKQGYILKEQETIESDIKVATEYEIKATEEWDVSKNQDKSIMAKWNRSDKSLTITGTGEMKSWGYNSTEDWHDNQYTKAIKRVSIEEGVTSIGKYAFSHCSRLTSMEIPSSVTSIGKVAFEGCSSLERITIPEGVMSISEWAFYGCSSLESITIPSSVTSIGDDAFCDCSSLESITIPSSVTIIGNSAFNGCSSLTSINVLTNNANYKSENGILFNKDKTEIIKYPEGKKESRYEIPSSVTVISWEVFKECSSLESITIPSSVTTIGSYAFSYCSSLKSIEIPSSVTIIRSNAFEGCSSLKKITIPEEVTSIEDEVFRRCSSLESIEILSSVTSIGERAFNGCSSLESITIPSTVTSIGYSAFSYCSSLESIIIPSSVTSIGERAFNGCSSLISIVIPSSVTSIGSYAFDSETILYVKQNSEAYRYAKANEYECIVDDAEPTVGYTPNGGNIANTENGIKVAVTDGKGSGVNESSLKYVWKQSTTEPNVNEFKESFTNNQTIRKPEGEGKWYLWVYAKDNLGNTAIKNSNAFTIDKTKPTIKYTPNGGNITNTSNGVTAIVADNSGGTGVNESSLRYVWTQSTTEPKVNQFSNRFTNGQTIKEPEEGIWYLWVYAEDNAGNIEKIHSNAFTIDKTKPTVEYTPNGGNIANTENGIKVTVKDNNGGSGVNESSLKYVWTQSTTEPNANEFKERFTNDQTINKPEEEGKWYLWVYAKDNIGNTAIKSSNAFTIDKTKPTVEYTPNGGNIANTENGIKVTVKDNNGGTGIKAGSLKYVWTQSTAEPNINQFSNSFTSGQTISEPKEGIWYLWVYAEDNAGNIEKAHSNAFTIDKTPSTPTEPTIKKGDINQDEKIDTTDLTKILRHISAQNNGEIAQKHPSWILTGNEAKAADINGNSKIDTTDLTKILRHIAAQNSNVAQNHPDWIIK